MFLRSAVFLLLSLFSASTASAQVYFNPANPQKQIYSVSINSQRLLEAKSVRAACLNSFRLLGPGRNNPSVHEIIETPTFNSNGVQTGLSFVCRIRYAFFSASNIRYTNYSGSVLCSSPSGWVPRFCDSNHTSTSGSVCIGNPVSIADGRKLETAIDWQSQIDPRFSLERHYTSDHDRVPDLSAFGYGTGWSSPWGKRIIEINSSRYVYHAPQGTRRAFVGSGTVVPETQGHPHTMVKSSPQYGGRHVISDGTGKIELFQQGANAVSYLDEVIWPDGYAISLEYDANSRLFAMEDNKGQRAEYTWDLTINPNTVVPVVSSIVVDSDYDGSAMAPEIQVDYTHYKTTYWFSRLMLRRALVTDLQSGQVLSNFRYTHWTNNFILAYIFDGRLNDAGDEFYYAKFGYGYLSNGSLVPSYSEHALGDNWNQFFWNLGTGSNGIN